MGRRRNQKPGDDGKRGPGRASKKQGIPEVNINSNNSKNHKKKKLTKAERSFNRKQHGQKVRKAELDAEAKKIKVITAPITVPLKSALKTPIKSSDDQEFVSDSSGSTMQNGVGNSFGKKVKFSSKPEVRRLSQAETEEDRKMPKYLQKRMHQMNVMQDLEEQLALQSLIEISRSNAKQKKKNLPKRNAGKRATVVTDDDDVQMDCDSAQSALDVLTGAMDVDMVDDDEADELWTPEKELKKLQQQENESNSPTKPVKKKKLEAPNAAKATAPTSSATAPNVTNGPKLSKKKQKKLRRKQRAAETRLNGLQSLLNEAEKEGIDNDEEDNEEADNQEEEMKDLASMPVMPQMNLDLPVMLGNVHSVAPPEVANIRDVLNEAKDPNQEIAPSELIEFARRRVSEMINSLWQGTYKSQETKRKEILDQLRKDFCLIYSYNDFMMGKIMDLFGSSYGELQEFLEACERERPCTIRTNSLKTNINTLRQSLIKRGMEIGRTGLEWSDLGMVVHSSKVAVGATPEYMAGHYMVQGPSSMLPVMALDPQPGEFVLDMCAAPGGKTTHIAQLMKNTGSIMANELKQERCTALIANLQRLGVANAFVVCQDGVEVPKSGYKFDRVMLDAPCTGTGTISKDPSVKQTRGHEHVQRVQNTQRDLILAAVDSLKDHGVLVYSTCSIFVEENESIVQWALEKRKLKLIDTDIEFGVEAYTKFKQARFHPSMKLAKRFYPHSTNFEGFFVAKLVKLPQDKNNNQQHDSNSPQKQQKHEKEDTTTTTSPAKNDNRGRQGNRSNRRKSK